VVATCSALLAGSCMAPEEGDCGEAPACRPPVGITLSPNLPPGTYEIAIVADAETYRCTFEFTDTSMTIIGGDRPGSGFCGFGRVALGFSWLPRSEPPVWDRIEIWNSSPRHAAVTLTENSRVIADGEFDLQYTPDHPGDPCIECPHAEVVLETALQ
jgi:hypothetical protein